MNIIVTGASRGIGYETVKQFASEEGNHILAISRNESKLRELSEECKKINQGSEVDILTFDLEKINTSQEEILSIVGKTFDTLNILINNAGYLVNKPFAEITFQEAEKMMNVNYLSAAFLIRTLLPLMEESMHAHIVNISSMGGFQGSTKFPGLAHYSASKAALAVLTECLAAEFNDMNISVNCLTIGAVQTEMLEEAFPGYRAPLKPSEIAKFICHFAATAQQYMNGKIVPVALSNP